MKRINLLTILAVSFSLTSFVACSSSEDVSAPDSSYFDSVTNESSTISDQAISAAEESFNSFDTNVSLQASGMQKASAMFVVHYPIITQLTDQKFQIHYGDNFTDKLGRIIKG